jgi:PKD repeat protein
MYQFSKLRISVLCFAVSLLLGIAGNAQIVAGIRANGKVLKNGDTINVCRGGSIVYQSTAQGSLNINWRFNNGLPASRTGIGPFSIFYNTVGTDTTFQYVGTGVFVDSMHIIVNVSDVKPSVAFSSSPDNVCGNEAIQFTNSSAVGEPLKYLWSFGDGTTSTEKDPSHQFLSAVGMPGIQTFPVKLVVSNANACADSVTRTVTIRKVPDAGIGNGDPTVIFEPFNGNPTFKKCNNIPSYNFKFTNQSTTIANNVSYSINWGDGSPDTTFTTWPTDAKIGHQFSIGSNTVTVSVTGQDGCIGIKEYVVFLGTVPAGGLASLGNTDICSSDSLRFAITNTTNNPPGTSYSFFINDGSATQSFKHEPPPIVGHFFIKGSCSFSSNNGLQTYNNAFGAYLTIENPCGSNSASVVPIYVSGKPRPSISVTSPVVCANTSVTIQNTSSFGSVITPGPNFTSTCIEEGKKVWTITPSTGFTLISGNYGSLNGNIANVKEWIDGSDQLNVQFVEPGIYTVKLYLHNNRCGYDSTFTTICVRTAPLASFNMSQKTSCGPATIKMNNTSPDGGCQGDDYRWLITYTDPKNCASTTNGDSYTYTNGTSLTSRSPSLTFLKEGRYIVRLSVRGITSNCTPAVAIDTFYVKGRPKAVIPEINTICTNSNISPTTAITSCYSPGPIGYLWQFDNGSPAISKDSLPGAVSYTDVGTHAIRLIVTDSSCMLSDTVNTTINIIPIPDAVAGNDTTVCSGQPALLGIAAGPLNDFTYQWSPVEGLSDPSVANPTALLYYTGPANDTTYKFYVTATLDNNCSKLDSISVTVKRSPVITISPASPQICIGSSVQMTAEGADTYEWSPAETLNISNLATVVAIPETTTTYTVKGTLNNGCYSEQTVTVTVASETKAEFLAPETTKCSPLNIKSLITTVPYPSGNATYNWYADDILIGSNSTGEVPSYIITTPGQEVVIKLVTLSAAGCAADSMQKTFVAIPAVTASFTKDKESSCAPLTVTFTNTSTMPANASFIWDFGNGVTSTDVQPGPVTYQASPYFRDTVYNVVLKGFNGCDTSYFRESVKVFAEAKAKFAVDTTRGCSPFTFSIINNSLGDNHSYYWDFGDGKTDTTYTLGTSFDYTYHTGVIQTFTVRLIAENQCSRDTQVLNIVVSPNTIKPFVAANGDQLSGCTPHRVTFTNSTVGASELTWNFGDNSPLVVTPNSQGSVSHLYNKAGNYKVIIRLRNDCSDTTIERKVTVYDAPVADFNVNIPAVCTGQPVVVTNLSSNANSYEWHWGDGASSSFTSGQHNYKVAGDYDIMLVAQRVHTSGYICTDTSIKKVRIADKIPAKINIEPGKACLPYTLKVSAENATTASHIEWMIRDSSTAEKDFFTDGATASHVFNVAGTYSVRLVVHTTTGCTDTATYLFNVFNTPRTVFEPQEISTCEHDTTVTFTAVTTHAGNEPVTYKWFINDQIEGSSNPFTYRFQASLTNTIPEEFSVKVVAQNIAGCGDTSLAGSVVIQPLPTPSISVSPSLVQKQPDYEFTFKDIAPTNPHKTYLWDMGDRSLQTRSGQEIKYEYGDTGTYKVKLLVNDFSTGCQASDSVSVTILYVPGYLQVPNAMCMGCSNYSLRQFLPLGKGLKTYRLRIYTTWGQKIFETTSLNTDGSPNVAWDGTFNGKPLQQDVYTWEIEATYKNETEWKGMIYPGNEKPVKAGFITIIK